MKIKYFTRRGVAIYSIIPSLVLCLLVMIFTLWFIDVKNQTYPPLFFKVGLSCAIYCCVHSLISCILED